ncbi:MAG: PAS domain-containing protein [Brevundimonas sp.]
MFHPDTQRLIDEWTRLAATADVRGGIPQRAGLLPEALGRLLPRVFVADWRDGHAALRLAGTTLEAFQRRPLRDEAILAFWSPASADLVTAAVAQSVREARPVVVVGFAPGEPSTPVEMVIAPLRSRSGRPDQILGLFAPASALTPTGSGPVLLTARMAVAAGTAGRPRLSLAAVEGRRIA